MDEFTDFQMAVGQSSLEKKNSNEAMKGLWVLDHPANNKPTNQNNTNNTKQSSQQPGKFQQQFVPPLAKPPDSNNLDKNSVGSRLANYNLGMKSSGLDNNDLQNQTHGTKNSGSNNQFGFAAASQPNSSSTTTNQNLLIGEEDKYAALRALVSFETDDSENSQPQQQQQIVPEQNAIQPIITNYNNSSSCYQNSARSTSNNVSHSTNLGHVSTNSTKEPPNDDEFGCDFGDFQSFTNHPSNGTNSQLEGLFDQPVQVQSSSRAVDNYQRVLGKQSSEESHSEYGEFVSVQQEPQPSALSSPEEEEEQDFNYHNFASKTTNPKNSTFNASTSSKTLSNPSSHHVAESLTSSANRFDNYFKPLTDHIGMQSPPMSKAHYKTSDATLVPDNVLIDDIRTLPPSFIKTSLIGYDGFVDSSRNIAEATMTTGFADLLTNNEAQDQKEIYQEKNKSFDISPETRSIASLDLGNYYTSPDVNPDNNGKGVYSDLAVSELPLGGQNSKDTKGLASSTPSNNSIPASNYAALSELDMSLGLDLDDQSPGGSMMFSNSPYSSRDENGRSVSPLQITTWTKCFMSSRDVLQDAISVFDTVSSSEVIQEVVLEIYGLDYINGLVEVYRLWCRINSSAGRAGCEKITALNSEIQSLWETLRGLFINTAILDMLTAEDLSLEDTVDINRIPKICGICGCKVQQTPTESDGALYHTTCANFWINTIDINLPSIALTKTEQRSNFNSPSRNNGYS